MQGRKRNRKLDFDYSSEAIFLLRFARKIDFIISGKLKMLK